MKFVGFRGMSQRVKDLEQEASPKSIGYVVVTNPRTEEQTERIARLQAEGNEVRLVADPYLRPEPPRAA